MSGPDDEDRRPPNPTRPSAVSQLTADLSPGGLFQSLTGGIVAGGISVAISLSFAALVFSGPLAGELPFGLGIALFSTACIGLITALGSAIPMASAGVQDSTTAIVAVAVGAVVARGDESAMLGSAVATIVVSSLVVGGVLYLVGRLRLGTIIRYMPFPVVGGFYAATGFLILDGAAGVVTEGGQSLLEFDSMAVWIPAAGIGLAVFLSGRLQISSLAMPAVLAAGIVAMRGAMAVAGVGSQEAAGRGWLFGPYTDQPSWNLDTIRLIAEADWGAVASEWFTVASMAVIAAIALLLNVAAVEHAAHLDVDADRELRVAGVASLASAAGGGMPGYLYLGDSLILHRVSGTRRLAAVLAAMTGAAVLVFGTSILDLVPKAVVGGVLIGLGLVFVVEWLWDARRRMNSIDLALVWIIGLTVIVAGFIAAIAIGVAVAIALFAVRYSRTDVVRHAYPLSATSSTVDRPAGQREILAETGARCLVIEVRGFVFFGTATRVFDIALDGLSAAQDGAQRVIFDLTGTSGLDSSLHMAFQRFQRWAGRHDVSVVFAGAPKEYAKAVAGAVTDAAIPTLVMDDLDSALRWAEEEVLREAGVEELSPASQSFRSFLAQIAGELGADALLPHAREIDASDDEIIIEAGAPAPGLYFLESGGLRAEIDGADGSVTPLRQMMPGAVIGEISLYRGGAATATVRSIGASRLRHISPEAVATIEGDDPAAAVALHRLAAAVLAERVIHAERGLRALR